jgi:NADPH-dependent glutamate synthase beta subunit-like oxidoreductase
VPDERSRSVLVVGAGVSGLHSALQLADMGVKVYLVERRPSMGGRVGRLGRLGTDPEGMAASCEIAPLIDRVHRHPNVTFIANAELTGLEGEKGAFTARVRRHPLRVTEECDRCGMCVQVCPIKIYHEQNEGIGLRTAIDLENPRSPGGSYNIETEIPICQRTCPVHIDIRRYVGLVASGKFEEALRTVRERNPFPAVCGRVCHHPCEAACNRGAEDEPIAIDALKRFAADYELGLRRQGKLLPPKPPPRRSSARAAIVGAGPAGLTVAHDLALMGYGSTVFERAPVAGGMLYLGIPEYRLPRDIIEAEVDYIRALGVQIKLNAEVGTDPSVDDLLAGGYGAVFLGVGAHKGLRLGIPGEEEYEGLLDCVEFLRRVNLGDRTKLADRVIVVGGGNSAIDSARTALRLGCEEVTILYRRSRREMPANPWEIEEAEHEGIAIHYLAAPVRILGEEGRVVGMLATRMELGRPDASGRRRPIPIEGSEFEVPCDLIIPAISQQPDLDFLPEGHGIELSRWSSFVVDEETGETNRPGIFAGGDAVTGPATVIEAIAAGHRAATAMAAYLEEG